MEPIEVARRLVRLGDTEDALKAYELVLRAQKHVSADEKLEAAIFVLQFQGEYRYAYLAFLELYKEKQYAQDVMAIMTEAFYEPNQKLLRSHYENNCKYLKRYPYLFQKDFIPFDELGGRSLVFILCSNTIGSLAGYTGCLNEGSVPLLLAQNLDKDMLESLITLYQPGYLWVPEDMRDAFPAMPVKHEAFGYMLLKTGHKRAYPLHDELCLLLTTSGSTGSPKFVRQSYENVLSNAAAIVQYLELDETERPITTLPMNYTYGLSIINSHLLVGAALLFTNKGIMQKEFWNFFKERKATSFGGVPYTYEMLDRLCFYRMDLPSLRYCTQAGGKLTPELHKKFAENAQERGTRFIVMYGQCEATARMGYLPAEKALEKYGSMGIAIPGGRFHLIDAEGKTVSEPHVTGELVYEGANVTMGYAECGEDLIKGDERRRVLQTGDMAQFDEDGYYYIVGRKKRFLKLYGNRVNLDEIDRMIKEQFHNADCASAGVDDHLYVFVTDQAVAEEVKPFLAGKTGINAVAFKTVVIDEIPKNDAGKTLYKELAKYYL